MIDGSDGQVKKCNMEQLIKDLSDAYANVKYHDDRANRSQAISSLNDMIGTCTMIIEKCNNLKNMLSC